MFHRAAGRPRHPVQAHAVLTLNHPEFQVAFPGLIFWFIRKKFSGSYFALTAWRRT